MLNYQNVRVSETESKLIKALIVYESNSFLPSIPVSLRWIRLRVSLCRQCCSLFSMERRRSIQWWRGDGQTEGKGRYNCKSPLCGSFKFFCHIENTSSGTAQFIARRMLSFRARFCTKLPTTSNPYLGALLLCHWNLYHWAFERSALKVLRDEHVYFSKLF